MNQVCYGEREAVYRDAIKLWGADVQEIVAIEECSEIIKEICKTRRGQGSLGRLAEEIADVTIMMEQLRLMYDINDEVCAFMDQKVLRLKKNIESAARESSIWLCRGE